MAKKIQQDPEDVAASKAEAVAKAVDAQVKEDARKQEEEAIKSGKDTQLLGEQVWQEKDHDNPFEAARQARIEEIRTNASGHQFVKFVVINPNQADVRTPFEYLNEAEFRARFPKLVK
jgi:hypothetical protein